jgi:hypothetical protein
VKIAVLDEDFNISFVEAPNPFAEPRGGPLMANAFEEQEPISEVEEQAVDPVRDKEIAALEVHVEKLRALHLYSTAELMQRRLDKLLQEKRDPLEG